VLAATALMMASGMGRGEVLKKLLDKGASVDVQNADGRPAAKAMPRMSPRRCGAEMFAARVRILTFPARKACQSGAITDDQLSGRAFTKETVCAEGNKEW
jgi:hypothetical protein